MAQTKRGKKVSAAKRAQPAILTKFHKSNACRVIHVDGGFGGITPQGNLHFAVYSEHITVPESVTYVEGAKGQPEELGRTGDGYLAREIEVELIMSRSSAQAIRDWLTTNLDKLDAIIAQARE